jgi:hypothetical protein
MKDKIINISLGVAMLGSLSAVAYFVHLNHQATGEKKAEPRGSNEVGQALWFVPSIEKWMEKNPRSKIVGMSPCRGGYLVVCEYVEEEVKDIPGEAIDPPPAVETKEKQDEVP